MRRVYILCPVRSATEEEKAELDAYVARLEAEGVLVHYPPRDVDQDDPSGLAICEAHRTAMRWATEVHVFWNPKSEGSVFDLGMAFMYDKPLLLINWDRVSPTEGKSYTNVLLALARRA